MPCELCYRDQVLTILSIGECSGPELDVWRIILEMEILAELHKKKRLWIFGRSDQQGTAGNPRENGQWWARSGVEEPPWSRSSSLEGSGLD